MNCTKAWDEQRQFNGLTLTAPGPNPVTRKMKEELVKTIPLQDPTIPSKESAQYSQTRLIRR